MTDRKYWTNEQEYKDVTRTARKLVEARVKYQDALIEFQRNVPYGFMMEEVASLRLAMDLKGKPFVRREEEN